MEKPRIVKRMALVVGMMGKAMCVIRPEIQDLYSNSAVTLLITLGRI